MDDTDRYLRMVTIGTIPVVGLLVVLLLLAVSWWSAAIVMLVGIVAINWLARYRIRRLGQLIEEASVDRLTGIVKKLLRRNGHTVIWCQPPDDAAVQGVEVAALAVDQDANLQVLVAVDRPGDAAPRVQSLAEQHQLLLLGLIGLVRLANGTPLPRHAHHPHGPQPPAGARVVPDAG